MEGLFTLENLFTLGMLIMLQAVLGFDNLLYISLESQRVEKSKQSSIRKWGIGLAVLLRIVLLFSLLKVLSLFTSELFTLDIKGFIQGTFNLKSIVVLIGGVFLIYTAIKEISHMMMLEENENRESKPTAYVLVLFSIVIMNAIFFFRLNLKRNGTHQKLRSNGNCYHHWRTFNGTTCR